MEYYQNFQLKNYNSFGLNSIVKEIWFPATIEELTILVKELEGKKFEILSGGTNVLFCNTIDRIICLRKMKRFNSTVGNNHLFLISASYPLNSFVHAVTDKFQLSGVEGLIGIPGTVGGALAMNSGSGKCCISDYLTSLEVIDLKGNTKYYTKKDLKFGRRYSILQDKTEIIVLALFEFGQQIPNQEMIKQVKEYRKDFPKGKSAGGIFINHYALRPYEKQIRHIMSDNLVISKYLNVIINTGKATPKEILEFINKIRKIVKEPLKLEIKIIGAKND